MPYVNAVNSILALLSTTHTASLPLQQHSQFCAGILPPWYSKLSYVFSAVKQDTVCDDQRYIHINFLENIWLWTGQLLPNRLNNS